MVSLGADAVFCQHSHIIGCAEEYEGGIIVYGQGNFHFVKYTDRPFWQQGLMVKLDIGENMRVDYLPVRVNTHGIDLCDNTEKEEILDGFAQRSACLTDGRWLELWRKFVEENSAAYLDCVRSALSDESNLQNRELFAHYLDCEAHLDMLRELFPTWHKDQTDGA